jgi:hypothetical protein
MKAQKTSERKKLQAIAITLLWLTAPTFVYASGDPVDYGITSGRLTSIIAGLLGLTSIITGGLALRSSAGAGFKKRVGTWSMIIGSLSTVLSLIHLATTTGGFGTGSGKAGAIVAIVLGVIGVTLGSMALSRSRRK